MNWTPWVVRTTVCTVCKFERVFFFIYSMLHYILSYYMLVENFMTYIQYLHFCENVYTLIMYGLFFYSIP